METRSFNPRNLYEPCPNLPREFRHACYGQLPRWWWATPLKGDYKKLVSFCDAVNDKNEGEACFYGIGIVAVLSYEYDPSQTVQRCQKMPHHSGEIHCRIGAASRFAALPRFQKFAPIVCGEIWNPIAKRCQ